MKRTMIAIAMLAALAAAPSQAGPLEDQLELLKKEVSALQQDIATLKSMLARDTLGNVTFRVNGNRSDLVGGDSSATIGRSSVTKVGANVSHQVGGSMSLAVARSILIEAGDQLMLKVGSASMLMQKSGEITISGSIINIKGSGDVVIKGSKVLTN